MSTKLASGAGFCGRRGTLRDCVRKRSAKSEGTFSVASDQQKYDASEWWTLKKLVHFRQDGVFSRFLFYVFLSMSQMVTEIE